MSDDGGTSTLAAGLAASLSETNDGKVLLVDVNLGPGEVHPFFKGKPAYPLNKALKPSDSIASAADNLYLATVGSSNTGGPAQLGLKKFFDMMPNMKASDFDYIIFDMPPLDQTSPAWGMAAFMDKLLLVVEAEKNTREVIKRSYGKLIAERNNVAVVVNKSVLTCRSGLILSLDWLHATRTRYEMLRIGHVGNRYTRRMLSVFTLTQNERRRGLGTPARAPTSGLNNRKQESHNRLQHSIRGSLRRLARSTSSRYHMLRNRIYYGLKPFVPQSLRTAIRRKLAMRLRKQCRRRLAYYAGIGACTGKLARLAGAAKNLRCSDARRREQNGPQQVPVLDATGTGSWIPLLL